MKRRDGNGILINSFPLQTKKKRNNAACGNRNGLGLLYFPSWYWLNTEKYALLDKLKAIKSIPYTEQEAQNLGARSTNWKFSSSHVAGNATGNMTVG